MDDYELLSQLETYIEQSFGVRVKHTYDHRLLRRFFSKLSFFTDETSLERGRASPVERWRPLDLFRSAHFQREALDALRMRADDDETHLANLLIPVTVKSGHAGVTQKMLDSVIRSFFLHRHVGKKLPLPQIHKEFATWLLFSLVSDQILVIETDFSHERNMVFKYTVRPFNDDSLRFPLPVSEASLFFSKTIEDTIRKGIYVGTHSNISDIFNRDIGYSDLERIDRRVISDLEGHVGFLVIAGKRSDYSCAYVAPLYSLLNKQSAVMKQMQALFDTYLDILGNEAYYRIERNKHHSRLRHTIGVSVGQLTQNYDTIFTLRSKILDTFKGDRNFLNIQFAKVNALVHELSKDVAKQFEIEFDILGNRRSRKGEYFTRVHLSPEQFSTLVQDVVRNAAGRRHAPHFITELGHRAYVEIASEGTLGTCFTELFNNAVKYNVANERIRIRTRDRNNEVIMTISNIGPSLSDQEEELMPLMGLRGMNSQRLVDEGSGQGLATVFSILEDIGVDADYSQHPLAKEQISRLVSEHGSKRISGLDLSVHTIELAFPAGAGGTR
jgi:anti-sigma regulatory factor (Ser/Thr protein kinase)